MFSWNVHKSARSGNWLYSVFVKSQQKITAWMKVEALRDNGVAENQLSVRKTTYQVVFRALRFMGRMNNYYFSVLESAFLHTIGMNLSLNNFSYRLKTRLTLFHYSKKNVLILSTLKTVQVSKVYRFVKVCGGFSHTNRTHLLFPQINLPCRWGE